MDENIDLLSLYLRDVDERDRLSREEEIRAAEEIAGCHQDIVELLRGLILEASEELRLDAEAAARLRAEISDPSNERWVVSFQRKLDTIATLVRSGRLLAEISASFGVSAELIDKIATAVAEKRQRIRDAKQRLVEGNLRLVVYFARRVKWRGVDIEDLIQEGNIALMRAADSFDPKRGFAFGSFACTAIRRAINRFGSAASQPVHVPAEVRARRGTVRQAARYLSEKYGCPASWDEIADYLEVPKAVVVDALGSGEEAIPLEVALEEGGPAVIDRLPDPTAELSGAAMEIAEEDHHVRKAVTRLDERERRIIEARFGLGHGEPATLAEIGQGLGVTRERARQLEGRSLRQLRQHGSAGDIRRTAFLERRRR